MRARARVGSTWTLERELTASVAGTQAHSGRAQKIIAGLTRKGAR
jgi:hypothetical protein